MKPLMTLIPFHIKFGAKKKKKKKTNSQMQNEGSHWLRNKKVAHRALGEWMQESGLAWCSTCRGVGIEIKNPLE